MATFAIEIKLARRGGLPAQKMIRLCKIYRIGSKEFITDLGSFRELNKITGKDFRIGSMSFLRLNTMIGKEFIADLGSFWELDTIKFETRNLK
jgi:hypothetical protein